MSRPQETDGMAGAADETQTPEDVPEAQPPESVGRGALMMSAGHAAQLVSHGGLHVMAARILAPEDYGRFALAMVALAWIQSLATTSVLPGLIKDVSEDRDRFPAALAFATRWYVVSLLLLSGAFFAVRLPLARWMGDEKMALLFVILCVQVPFAGAARAGIALLCAIRRYRAAGVLKTSHAVLSAVGGAALLLADLGAAGAVAGLMLGHLITAGVAVAMVIRQAGRSPHRPHPPMARRALHWTATMLPSTAAIAALLTVDMWMVKAILRDSDAAGMYAVAYSLSRLPFFLVWGLSTATFPSVSEAHAAGDWKTARAVSRESMRLALLAFIPLCFIALGEGREIIRFLFTARYMASAPCYVVLAPAMLCAAQMVLSLHLVAATNRPELKLAVTCGSLAAAIALAAFWIPRQGILGAALASLSALAFGAAAGTLLARRFVGALPPVSTLWKCVLAGFGMYAVSLAWPLSGPILVLKLALLGLTYVAVLFGLRELRGRDMRKFLQSAVGS